MRYDLAFKYAVSRPGGWNTVLLVGLCSLVPVVGQIVLLGYLAEVAERLLRDPDLHDHPEFSFDRFMAYFQRGLWPFVVQLIVGTALSLVLLVAGGVPLAIATALDVPILGVVAFAVVEVAAAVAAAVVLWPATLQAQLANKLDLDGQRWFVPAFWRKLGVRGYASIVVYSLIALGISIIGLLACVVGVIPASGLAHLAAQHLMVQHYRAYLDAGGTPVGEKPGKRPPKPTDEGEAMELD